MPWESRVLSVTAPLPLTSDPTANTIAAVLTTIEDQLGERRGWDRPAHLFTLRLLPGGQVEVAFASERLWNHRRVNPADALRRRANSLPRVPDIIQPGDMSQASVAAFGFMFEGWNRPAHAEMPEPLGVLHRMGTRVNHLLPDRQEVRVVHAVDLNQRTFHIVRPRGEQPHVSVAGQHDDAPSADGTVPSALARIMHAVRRHHRVFPGQPL
jgi:hypothetical protein